jgi:hypothetical protein
MPGRRPGPDHLDEAEPGSAGAQANAGLRDGRSPHVRVVGSREPLAARVVFWEALDPIERDAFRAVASHRTFAAGARLIAEGDQADHVIVILSGRTEVYVEENGRERFLAERGPGQLVGERAVLQVSLRSATVIALDRVQALVVRTGDFAAFISAHPRVLGIVRASSMIGTAKIQPDMARMFWPEFCPVRLRQPVGAAGPFRHGAKASTRRRWTGRIARLFSAT